MGLLFTRQLFMILLISTIWLGLPDHYIGYEQAFPFPKSGFSIIRHNEIHDLTASLLVEVYHEVQVEPTSQPITF